VPGAPAHGQTHDRSQIGQVVAAGLALQEGAMRSFTDLPGQRDHNPEKRAAGEKRNSGGRSGQGRPDKEKGGCVAAAALERGD
jgi:hypothetical protein